MKFKYNCPLPEDTDKYTMDEKEFIPEYLKSISTKFQAAIVEKQDEIIHSVIQEIGGETYHRITIDRNKVLDALSKAMPKKVTVLDSGDFKFACPTCTRICYSLTAVGLGTPEYCRYCGQKLDWSRDREDKDEEESEE